MAKSNRNTRTPKSPIETMLRNGIVKAAGSNGVAMSDYSGAAGRFSAIFHEGDLALIDRPDECECDVWGLDESTKPWALYGDVHIESYRVDFLLQVRGDYIAIECDGHEWHERTKQQAAYDKSRDRELLALGIRTTRFTGSEIHHSIDRCVADIYKIANAIHAAAVARSETFNAWHAELRRSRIQTVIARIDGDNRVKDSYGNFFGLLSGVV